MDIAEVALHTCFCGSELARLEPFLSGQKGVRSASVDRTRSVVHLEYDRAATTAERLEGVLADAGYECDCRSCPDSCCQPGHPAVGSIDEVASHEHHPSHEAAHRPAGAARDTRNSEATHGQRDESVQRAVDGEQAGHAVHAVHEVQAGQAEHAWHDEHAGHGSEMVNGMLRRFVVSAILTIPIVIFSPIGEWLGITAEPPFGMSMSWFGLILATPVVWWGGWPFISSAARSLRHGDVNMMTLISTGILVAYMYSVGATS